MKRPLRYLSLFSGISAEHVAWESLGWECVAVAEIDQFACSVLRERLPGVPNLGDVRGIDTATLSGLGHIDLVVGGSPCQDLSTAGTKAGLSGARSGLFFEQMRIFNAARDVSSARWMLWENVLGALSSKAGRDFASVVGSMAWTEFGVPSGGWRKSGAAAGPHGLVEWRVLDAQFIRVDTHTRAVPQRRRRVFAFLDSGDWASRPPVLLEPEGLRRDTSPRRVPWPAPAAYPAPRPGICCDAIAQTMTSRKTRNCRDDCLIPTVAHTLTGSRGSPIITLCADLTQITSPHNRSNPQPGGPAPTLAATSAPPVLAFQSRATASQGVRMSQIAPTCDAAKSGGIACLDGQSVRRLTPRECERLMGLPDDWTMVQHRGRPATDAPRYRACGLSIAVNCLRWIGLRLDDVLTDKHEDES